MSLFRGIGLKQGSEEKLVVKGVAEWKQIQSINLQVEISLFKKLTLLDRVNSLVIMSSEISIRLQRRSDITCWKSSNYKFEMQNNSRFLMCDKKIQKHNRQATKCEKINYLFSML